MAEARQRQTLVDFADFRRRVRAIPLRRHNFYIGLLSLFLFLIAMLRVCSLGPGSL